MDEPVTITLTRDEALVLFDLLFGFQDQVQLGIGNHVGRVVLWKLEASLEKALVEPFLSADDYRRRLQQAQGKVTELLGPPSGAF